MNMSFESDDMEVNLNLGQQRTDTSRQLVRIIFYDRCRCRGGRCPRRRPVHGLGDEVRHLSRRAR